MLRVILLAALIAAVLVFVIAPAAAAECWQYGCCWTYGSTGSGPGQFQGPRGFRLGPPWGGDTYHAYVVDSGNNRVQVLLSPQFAPGTETDAWLIFERQIGRWGSGAGELINPTGIEIHGSIVYIVDTGNHRIQQFTLDGSYVGQIGHYGQGDGEFDSPQFAAVIDSVLYVTDAGNHRVQKFTLEGEYVGQWGSEGTGPGQFLSPSGIAAGRYPFHNIVVGDRERGIMQEFTPAGALVEAQSAPGVEGFEGGASWLVYDYMLSFVGYGRGCEGVAFGPPFDFLVSGIVVVTFVDSVNDRLVFWLESDPVEHTTWGSLKTRYLD